MKSVILAAGSGNRLRPITNKIPKCLVEIGGKSLLEWQISSLIDAGISEINIVIGYKHTKILSLNENRINNIYFNKKYSSTNMVKSLLTAENLFNTDLIISYSDIIYTSNIVHKLLNSEYKNAIIVDLEWHKLWSKRFDDPLEDAETLIYDNNFSLKDIGRKTKDLKNIMAQYIGLLKFERTTLNFLKKLNSDKRIDDNLYMTDLLRIFIDNDIDVKVIPIERGWLEIDSLNDLSLYKNALNTNSSNLFSIFS